MILKCYVLDDEPHAIRLLSKYIEKTPGLEVLGTEINPLKALNEINNNASAPDITFADIDMPDLSGLDFAELAKAQTEIIFTTAHPDYAVDAFETGAIDYLVKPFSYQRFLKAVNKAREKISLLSSKHATVGDNDYFFIKSEGKGKLIKIWHEDIVFIEGKLNYVLIHTLTDDHTTYLTMKEIEENLPPQDFLRVHKSFIVNVHRIKGLESNHIIMQNGIEVAIGSSYRKGLFSKEVDKKLLKSKRLP